jgi:hypothetical protein
MTTNAKMDEVHESLQNMKRNLKYAADHARLAKEEAECIKSLPNSPHESIRLAFLNIEDALYFVGKAETQIPTYEEE